MTERDTFHHGNLRQALIEAGHAALNESGVDGLSLRKLAQQVGVSQSAPYRHFENKEALLQELIDGGLGELLVAYEKSATGHGSPRDILRSACSAYLDFAEGRAGLFQLVFEGNGMYRPTSVTSSEEAPSFILFVQLVVAAGTDIPQGEELAAASVCWSIIHGFAALNSHGSLASSLDLQLMRDTVLDAAVSAVENWGAEPQR